MTDPDSWGEIQPKGLPSSWRRYRHDYVNAGHIEGLDVAGAALVVSDQEADGPAYVASDMRAVDYLPGSVE